jgi:hypothetical protein
LISIRMLTSPKRIEVAKADRSLHIEDVDVGWLVSLLLLLRSLSFRQRKFFRSVLVGVPTPL